MKTNTKAGKNILTIDLLYNIFNSKQYKDVRKQFADEPFVQRNATSRVTQLSEEQLKNAPLLYRHIIAERILYAPDEEINSLHIEYNNPKLLLHLCYLWMNPITWIEQPENEGLILVNGRIAKETRCFLPCREKIVKQRFDRFTNLGIIYFTENFDNCFIPNDGAHNWDYITLNLYDKYQEILDNPNITLEQALDCLPYNIRALNYCIRRIILPKYGELKAAHILKELQKDWSTIRLAKHKSLSQLTERQIKDFETFIFHEFETDLYKWEYGDRENGLKCKPILRNSFRNRLDQVYNILRDQNFVEDGIKDNFVKAMQFQPGEYKRINWRGKKYDLASFVKYAFEGSKELTWEAANMWMCNGNVITHPELKNNYNRSVKASDTKFWEDIFMKQLK